MIAYSLEDLLPSNVLQASIQVLDLGNNILNLSLIGALNIACLANSHVERDFDTANLMATKEPPNTGGSAACGRKTNLVCAGISGGKSEAALVVAFLRYYAVVVVEDFVDGDGEANAAVGIKGARMVVILCDFIVSFDRELGSS